MWLVAKKKSDELPESKISVADWPKFQAAKAKERRSGALVIVDQIKEREAQRAAEKLRREEEKAREVAAKA